MCFKCSQMYFFPFELPALHLSYQANCTMGSSVMRTKLNVDVGPPIYTFIYYFVNVNHKVNHITLRINGINELMASNNRMVRMPDIYTSATSTSRKTSSYWTAPNSYLQLGHLLAATCISELVIFHIIVTLSKITQSSFPISINYYL